MQLPVLTNGMEWKAVVNTNCEYEDGKNFANTVEVFGPNTVRVPARTTIVFLAK